MLKTAVLVLAIQAALLPCAKAHGEFGRSVQTVSSREGVVVSATKPASEIGNRVLRDGGNAVDAAVAVGFALAVTWPEAGNVGGGGFMLVAPPHEEVVCIDYRETAPALAHRHMYANPEDQTPHRTIGVPGTVAGLFLAHREYGKLEWRTLLLPSVQLAREGFTVDQNLASSMNDVLVSQLVRSGGHQFAELRRVYGKPNGDVWVAGDILKLPDLADTLGRIAEFGSDGFYKGTVAHGSAKDMQDNAGLITTRDLDGYDAKIRKASPGRYGDFEIFGAPPPSSGGICTILAMNMLETFELKENGSRYSLRTLHLTTEVMRRVFQQRAAFLGDPDFVIIPDNLTSKHYAKELAETIEPERATKSIDLAGPIAVAGESNDTTHFSIIDRNGMAVSNTYTLESQWGSKVVAPGTGVVLNDEMGDFNRTPGLTDVKGRIGTEPNVIAPGKRMLSSQAPTIVRRDGRVVLITGSPGGRTIINTVISILIGSLEYEMPIDRVVRAPRQHHQWFPDRLNFEGISEPNLRNTVQALKEYGHTINVDNYSQGAAHSIACDREGVAMGVADWRRRGFAIGVSEDKFSEAVGTASAQD